MVDEDRGKSFLDDIPDILKGLAALIAAIGSSGILLYFFATPIPSITFEASPNSITIGDSATLSWRVTNADSVSIDPEVGSTANSGAHQVSPRETTTYTLTAKNRDKVASKQTQVVVRIIPTPEIAFEIHPKDITSGNSAELIWNVTNAESVSIDPEVGSTTNSGTHQVSPRKTTTYTLTAKNRDKVASKQTRIVVRSCSSFTIPPTEWKGESWFSTGLSVTEGDTVSIACSGQVQPDSGALSCGPEGTTAIGEWSALYSFHSDWGHEAVIAKIGGSGNNILIGSGSTFISPADGLLILGVNDKNPPDNSGYFVANVCISQRG